MITPKKLQKDADYAKAKKLLLVFHCQTECVIGTPTQITEDYAELADGWMCFQNAYGMPIKPRPEKHYKTISLGSICSVNFATPDELNEK